MKYTLNQKIFCEYVEIVKLVKNMNKYITHISLLNKSRSMYIFLLRISWTFLKKYVMIVHFIDWFTYPLVSFVLHLNTATNQHMAWSSCIKTYTYYTFITLATLFSGLPIDDVDHFRAFNRIYKGFFQIKSAFTADAFTEAFKTW